MRSTSPIIEKDLQYHYLPQEQYGQNMIEKMQPYETPIMKRLGTIKDLTRGNGAEVPISGEVNTPNTNGG